MRARCVVVCRLLAILLLVLRLQAPIQAAIEQPEKKRPVTIADGIEMTRLAYPNYVSGVSSKGIAAEFSPNGEQFALILRKGILKDSVNEFVLLRFRTSEVFRSPKPDVLARFYSSSNRDGISHLRWLADSETVVFLGERRGEVSQIYTLNIRTRSLRQLTHHDTAVTSYDITPNGRTLLFLADPRENKAKISHSDEVLIDGQWLPDLLTEKYQVKPGEGVFLQTSGHAATRISVGPQYYLQIWSGLSLSPGGQYAVIGASPREVPMSWSAYQDSYLQTFLSHAQFKGSAHSSSIALVYDRKSTLIAPAVNAPASGYNGDISVRWAADGKSFFLRTYLPPEMWDAIEEEAGKTQASRVEVKLPSREVTRVAEPAWPKETPPKTMLDVTVEEDVNSPPKIFVVDPHTKQRAFLLDLNPNFQDLDFGHVEIVDLKVSDQLTVKCGLYLPPGYSPDTRYPLVIQTHGFEPERFSMDGLNEWSSGYAARPLAAKGVIVLQTFSFKDQNDALQYNSGKTFGVSREQGERNLNRMVYEKAIDYLDEHGFINRNLVGIIGFSRTVCFVAYTLTHSDYHFAAASLVDGIDCGYFEEIAYPQDAWDFDRINGGALPFGYGLKLWLTESPGFLLHKVETPVSLLSLNPANVLAQWEWYAGLALQQKPVEFALIPDPGDGANHLLTKPWERMIAERRLVDWFCFWLKGEEDREKQKVPQYGRWREMREEQMKRRPQS
jgi:dipeptidyl aminopeptidase/acylaminoacyl peptidase